MGSSKEYMAKWRRSEKGIEAIKKHRTKWRRSEKGIAAKRAYRESALGRAQQARERAKMTQERRDTARESGRRGRAALKHEVLVAYSQEIPACTCCGENIEAFLVLDHVNGGGGKHRSAAAAKFYHWLRREGFPREPALQVLCCNCNWGRQINGGVCPHQA